METVARSGPRDPSAPAWRAWAVDVALSVVLVAVVLSVTWVYVASERTFYFWDQAAYHDIAAEAASAFRKSAGSGFVYLQESFTGDYNALFALPLVPWLLAFGDSRLAFELSLAFCCLVPLPLAIGAVAVRLVPTGGRAAFWLAAGLTLLLPMTWVPTFRGYPDSGGAALMVVATLVFLEDDRLRKPRTLVVLGGLLGLAVVFRRHFAYAVVAFLLSILAHAALPWPMRDRDRPGPSRLVAVALRVLLVGGIALAVAAAVGYDFVRRMLAYDFPTLYRSYEQPLGALAAFFSSCYGWITLLLACAGFGVAALSPFGERRRASFVLLFAVLSWAQWWLLVRQVGEQYTLHFTPTIVLGLVLLLLTPFPGPLAGLRPSAVVLVLGSSIANLVFGLWGPETHVPPSLEALVVERWTPLVRSDYSEIADLVRVLRAGGPERGVFVLASSTCLNSSIVSSADRTVPGATGALEVLPVPAADSDGYYPLNELLAARYVLLARPFQDHLGPREQLILRTVYDTFAAGRGMAWDFAESPRVFRLDGCTVSLLERQRPTASATALAMLRAFEERVPRRPGLQPDWVVIDRRFPTWLTRNADGSTMLVAHPAPRGVTPSTTFVAVERFAGPIRSKGDIRFHDARCQGATLRFWAMGKGGAPEPLQEIKRRPEDDGHFSVRVAPRPGERLFLSLLEHAEGASIDYCLLTIDPFVVVTTPPVP